MSPEPPKVGLILRPRPVKIQLVLLNDQGAESFDLIHIRPAIDERSPCPFLRISCMDFNAISDESKTAVRDAFKLNPPDGCPLHERSVLLRMRIIWGQRVEPPSHRHQVVSNLDVA